MRKLQLQFCDCVRVFVCDDNGNSNGNDYNDSNNNNSERTVGRNVARARLFAHSCVNDSCGSLSMRMIANSCHWYVSECVRA